MAQGILIFIEERDGAVKKTSLEALGAARKLADVLQEPVTALCFGSHDPSVSLAHFGAHKILRARHDLLATYSAEGFASVVVQVAKQAAPRIILGAATAMGRDFLPRADWHRIAPTSGWWKGIGWNAFVRSMREKPLPGSGPLLCRLWPHYVQMSFPWAPPMPRVRRKQPISLRI